MKQTVLCSLLAAATAVSPMAQPVLAGNFARELGDSIADTVEKVMPSVVVVRTEATRYKVARDWYFGQLYGIPERLAGQGSGVIISKDGYVLTNSHVIDDAQEIEIVLDDGTKYPAKLIGQDPHTDVAVVKIMDAGSNVFQPVETGDSDTLRVGEFVIAIGSPFSLASSVTYGIVSQKGRAIGALPYEDFIQSDAAVNPGNSGGALVDADGRLVGINTMIQTSGASQGSIGISFAIPVNLAMTVAQSLIKSGSWERPWLGISMDERSDKVFVEDIVPRSPADDAGLKPGDHIVKVANEEIDTAREVQRTILRHAVGDKVLVVINRAGREIEFTIPTGKMPPPAMVYGR